MTASTGRRRIGLIPLDERPVNYSLPRQIAALADCEVVVPPLDLLGERRRPGDHPALKHWLWDEAPRLDALVVAIDQFVHGGLVPSRLGDVPIATLVERLDELRLLKAEFSNLTITGFGAVMRLSDSNNDTEEPTYWAEYGQAIAGLYGDLHRSERDTARRTAADIPRDLREDVALRRLRNHAVNLATIELVSVGVVDLAVIPSDDTARWSAGAQEQEWLAAWRERFDIGDRVLNYPGADEVCAVLVARACSDSGTPTRTTVHCAVDGGLGVVAPFEDRPVGETVDGQLAAAGVDKTVAGDADFELVVHPPSKDSIDLSRVRPGVTDASRERASLTARLVRELLDRGRPVALADVAHANGADDLLATQLLDEGTLERLSAYGAWNTAANTTGGVVATAVCRSVGAASSVTGDLALARRIVEDWFYMARCRSLEPAREQHVHASEPETLDGERARETERQLSAELGRLPRLSQRVEIRESSLRFPWNRAFEIDLDLVARRGSA
jgi:Protein of unknown function (DUF4127)